jgi:pimeloyl-ACP methyl ester carboxylesterase
LVSATEEPGEVRSERGRLVTFSRYGRVDGQKVLFHYGTPGTRHLGPMMWKVVERHHVDLLVLDRPGYGTSTRWPARRIANVVEDAALVADSCGWNNFAVWGGSGGGPHALACAALLADRVDRCASVVGPAPFEAEGLSWFEGMSPGNVEEFTFAQKGEKAYRPLVERLANEAVDAVRQGGLPIPEEYELPPADVAALRERLAEPGFLERTIAANLHGVEGWTDDCIAMTRSWGFDPAQITVPVSVWYGPDDVLCPAAHAEWLLAHIPGAERRVLPAGHLLGDDELDSIYQWLLTGT